jgi:hypothetical protein
MTKGTIMHRCLNVMTLLAHGLPVALIPELIHVTSMWDDMIHYGCWCDTL